ncbi:uncharacterized protein LOC125721577 [Brienomyrus brachyistius]|uniref:uncharacterized protein LOC125721577 n=1 Tax=Brienomyrus brachyistius TaxID=42636 RepID=UPI0020B1C9BD|nr:uncharacterized protein LOC125721577 [Brienomyrus brachyistius]
MGNADQVLRDQFVTGLQDADLRQNLNRLIRRRELKTFDQVRTEVLWAEEDRQAMVWQPPACAQVSANRALDGREDDWKAKLQEELLQEVRGQFEELQNKVMSELRDLRAGADSRMQGIEPMPQGIFKLDRPDTRAQVSGVELQGLSQSSEVLVGTCPLVTVGFNGMEVECLLDTGSEVSLLPENVFDKLPGRDERVVGEATWLTLRAANGLEIPYVGYALVDVKVGGLLLPKKGVVVVKDLKSCQQPILGMNIIGACWKELLAKSLSQSDFLSGQVDFQSHHGWAKALAHCKRVVAEAEDIQPGHVWIGQRKGVIVPGQSEMVLAARVFGPRVQTGVYGLVEPLEGGGSVDVARSVVKIEGGRVLLQVRNLHPAPVQLHRHQKLARVTQLRPADIVDPVVTLREVEGGVIEVGVRAANVEPAGMMPLLQELIDRCEGLMEEEREQVQGLVTTWAGVFSSGDHDLGSTDAVRHTIPTGNGAPVRERYRPVPPTLYQEMNQLLQGMLSTGVIRESSSPWAAPVVLVRKKDGALRFCVDYRKLNAITHKDAYPLPRIEEALTNLKQAKYFSTLDLASGYWQVAMDQGDREKTAFATPMGLFEFEKMAFGLCNAPATFQRLMQRCLGDLGTDKVLVYLDDVIIFSVTFKEHLGLLEKVLSRLGGYGLKLKPQKCKLFQHQVQLLGHVVDEAGVHPDPEKIRAVTEWQPPKTVREVRSFLGFAGYYRRFIKGFAKIARPLHALLVGMAKKGQAPVVWTEECSQAFVSLKERLTQAPVLAFADFSLPFRLYTDASLEGLGAVLAQVQDGQEHVIAYASRSLHPAEKKDSNYSSFKLELLALKWAVTEKFKDYLWGAQFTVYTDNNPLAHLRTARLGATEQRWMAQLENYTFDLKYRPGKENVNADVLSRRPDAVEDDGATPLPRVQVQQRSIQVEEEPSWGWDPARWKKLQSQDVALRQLAEYVSRGHLPDGTERKRAGEVVRKLLRHWPRLSLREGVLMRRIQDSATLEVHGQILVPLSGRKAVWEEVHVQVGHLGGEKTLSVLRRRFFWLNMETDNRDWIAACERCVVGKSRTEGKAPLVPIVTSAPLEVVGFTPHYVMFGTQARLPLDLVLGTWTGQEQVSVEGWVQQHHQRLVRAYQKVIEHSARASDHQAGADGTGLVGIIFCTDIAWPR